MTITALDLWRHECRTGRRTRTQIDGLYRAACYERQAADYEARARASRQLAERSETASERTIWERVADTEQRDADACRAKADAALLDDTTHDATESAA